MPLPDLRVAPRRVLLLSLASLVLSGVAIAKPKLLPFKADWCGPCRQFQTDCQRDPRFLKWLSQNFELAPAVNADACQELVRKHRIERLPTFLILGDQGEEIGRVVGYQNRHDLARKLTTAAQAPPARTKPQPPPVAPPNQPIVPNDADEIRQANKTLQDELNQTRAARELAEAEALRERQRAKALEKLKERLKAEAEELRQRLEQPAAELFEQVEEATDSARESLGKTIESTVDTVASAVAADPPPADSPAPSNLSRKWLGIARAVGGLALTVAAPEVAIPGSVAMTAAGLGLRWWLKRRRQGQERPATTATTCLVDTPPGPTRHRLDTQFVNVESDNYQRAHEQARQHIARRYPGSQEVLEAELSLTRQFMAGQV